MKKESFTLFMKQVAVDLQQSGNLGTAHVYRSTLNAILTFQGSDRLSFWEITPEWLKHFEGSLRARGCSWNTVSTYLRTLRAVYNRAVDLRKASSITMMFQNPAADVKEMLKLMAKCNSGLHMIFVGNKSGEQAVCELTAEELKEVIYRSSEKIAAKAEPKK